MTVNISSSNEWQRILGSSTIVVTDCKCLPVRRIHSGLLVSRHTYLRNRLAYQCANLLVYADWCGPCKMIAPTFDSLSTKYSKPGRITFCKVNVDNQQPIAQAHGVRAMPTFLVFKNGAVIDTIQGANPPALTAAVEKAVKLAGNTAAGASFKTPGRTLGGPAASSGTPGRRSGGQTLGGRPWKFSPFHIFNAILTFFGLYFASLFSVSQHPCLPLYNNNKPQPGCASASVRAPAKRSLVLTRNSSIPTKQPNRPRSTSTGRETRRRRYNLRARKSADKAGRRGLGGLRRWQILVGRFG